MCATKAMTILLIHILLSVSLPIYPDEEIYKRNIVFIFLPIDCSKDPSVSLRRLFVVLTTNFVWLENKKNNFSVRTLICIRCLNIMKITVHAT